MKHIIIFSTNPDKSQRLYTRAKKQLLDYIFLDNYLEGITGTQNLKRNFKFKLKLLSYQKSSISIINSQKIGVDSDYFFTWVKENALIIVCDLKDFDIIPDDIGQNVVPVTSFCKQHNILDDFEFNKKDYHELAFQNGGSKKVIIDWSLGNTCNYRCSYCPDALHDGSINWHNISDIKRVVTIIHKHYFSIGKTLWIRFTGGETTLYPNFKELLEYIKNFKGIFVSINSNGSRTQKYWSSILPYVDDINFTYHSEFSNKQDFLSLLKYITHSHKLTVQVTMHPEDFDEKKELFNQILGLNSKNVVPIAKTLFKDFGKTNVLLDYSHSQLEDIGNLNKLTREKFGNQGGMNISLIGDKTTFIKPSELISKQENTWIGWDCAIGLESLSVNFQGDIYRGVCGVGGKIGNISNNDIKFPKEMIICSKLWCTCVSDIMTTKKYIN